VKVRTVVLKRKRKKEKTLKMQDTLMNRAARVLSIQLKSGLLWPLFRLFSGGKIINSLATMNSVHTGASFNSMFLLESEGSVNEWPIHPTPKTNFRRANNNYQAIIHPHPSAGYFGICRVYSYVFALVRKEVFESVATNCLCERSSCTVKWFWYSRV